MPATAEALAVILLAIVPGYLARTAWARGKTFGPPTTDLTLVIQSVAASAVVQIAVSPLTIVWILPAGQDLGQHPWRVAVWLAVTVLLALLGGFAFGLLTNQFPSIRWQWLRNALIPNLPTLWDVAHIQGRIPALSLLVVEFTDGRRLAGAFAEGSTAVTSPQQHGIFLEEEWEVGEDGLPTIPMRNSGGLAIVDLADVRSVHVFVPSKLAAETR